MASAEWERKREMRVMVRGVSGENDHTFGCFVWSFELVEVVFTSLPSSLQLAKFACKGVLEICLVKIVVVGLEMSTMPLSSIEWKMHARLEW